MIAVDDRNCLPFCCFAAKAATATWNLVRRVFGKERPNSDSSVFIVCAESGVPAVG
jgi:hypothetical protein